MWCNLHTSWRFPAKNVTTRSCHIQFNRATFRSLASQKNATGSREIILLHPVSGARLTAMRLPKRSSLISETVRALREGISAGEWNLHLPGERTLCVRLQVSRSTLREALRSLERQRLVSSGGGRARKIHQVRASAPPVSREIGVLSLRAVQSLSSQSAYYLNELRERLQDVGFQVRLFSDQRLQRVHPQKFLENLLQENRFGAWLLFSVPAAVQRWFQARGVPTLVVGSCHEGVRLPSFDLDLHAVCRHAVGLLRARGHQHVGLLRWPQKTGGMRASEEGFFEGAALPGHTPCQAQLITHEATPESICLSLDRMLASRHPPTGIVVCEPGFAVCAASYLFSRKLSLPQDFSLISRDDNEMVACFRPEITRYGYRRPVFAHRLSRLTVQLALQGSLPAKNYLLLPKLIPGRTVGPPAS